MPETRFDPLESARKNAHVWRGARSTISYSEKMDDSFSVLVLYDLGDKKRRLFLDVDNRNQKVEFKNEEIDAGLYDHLEGEIAVVEKMLNETKS